MHDEFFDLELPETRPADRKPADRETADGHRPESDRTEGQGPDRQGAERRRSTGPCHDRFARHRDPAYPVAGAPPAAL